jgi:hypothetical protein
MVHPFPHVGGDVLAESGLCACGEGTVEAYDLAVPASSLSGDFSLSEHSPLTTEHRATAGTWHPAHT